MQQPGEPRNPKPAFKGAGGKHRNLPRAGGTPTFWIVKEHPAISAHERRQAASGQPNIVVARSQNSPSKYATQL